MKRPRSYIKKYILNTDIKDTFLKVENKKSQLIIKLSNL